MIIKPEGLKKRFFIVYFYGRASPCASNAGGTALRRERYSRPTPFNHREPK